MGNNVNYPAIAVNGSGRGVMAFTLVGNDYFPSAGYTSLDAKIGAGDIHVAAAGVGPQDGFTGYYPFSARRVRQLGHTSHSIRLPGARQTRETHRGEGNTSIALLFLAGCSEGAWRNK